MGRFHLVALYNDLSSAPGWAHSTMIKLSNKSVNEVKHFWAKPCISQQGRSWFPPEKGAVLFASLVTDASKVAWGGHLHL